MSEKIEGTFSVPKFRRNDYEYLYTRDEMSKTLTAIREKYKISECDELPYSPQGIKVKLTGKILEEAE